jgi:hypothetical protein
MASKTRYRVEVIPVHQIGQHSEMRDAAQHWIDDAIQSGRAECFCCPFQWKSRQELESTPPLAFVFIEDLSGPDNEVFVSAICSACCTRPDRHAHLRAACRHLGEVHDAQWLDEESEKEC